MKTRYGDAPAFLEAGNKFPPILTITPIDRQGWKPSSRHTSYVVDAHPLRTHHERRCEQRYVTDDPIAIAAGSPTGKPVAETGDMRLKSKPAQTIPFMPDDNLRRCRFWRSRTLGGAAVVPLIIIVSVAVLGSGCRVVQETANIPRRAVSVVVPMTKSGQPDPAALQTELQRYADGFASQTVAALDDYARLVGTPEARNQALVWKLSVSSAAVFIVSGANPTANLLDLLVLATITRTALEEDWVKTAQGAAFQPWLEVSRTLETNAWNLAEGILKPDQQQELRASIRQWWDSNPAARGSFFARPQEFSSLVRQTGEKTVQPGSVFDLVGLDPTAGLDPAVREVTRTRLFAERAMYTVQRMPFLVRWQVELLTGQLLSGPQVATVLTNVTTLTESADRISRATESVSQTAVQLPDRITAERKAILDALETQEGKLRELSAEVARTLTAGENMSTSLNTTLTTFDALMKRFGVGEPETGTASDTNSPPFNILDYARTAEQVALMAKELDVLIKNVGGTLDSPALNKQLRDLTAVADRAKADAKSVLNHAFLLGAGLLLLTFACVLAYRRLAVPGAIERSGGGG